MTHQVIAICGNVAVGKSTVCAALRVLGWEIIEEDTDANRFLPWFYQDMHTWGFHSQVTFLLNKLLAYKSVRDPHAKVAFDRHIAEDAIIFERAMHAENLISNDDHALYESMFQAMTAHLPPVQCYVVIDASVDAIMRRIQRRGRAFEQGIDPQYISALQERYDQWVASLPPQRIVRIDSESLDVGDARVVSWLNDEVERVLRSR